MPEITKEQSARKSAPGSRAARRAASKAEKAAKLSKRPTSPHVEQGPRARRAAKAGGAKAEKAMTAKKGPGRAAAKAAPEKVTKAAAEVPEIRGIGHARELVDEGFVISGVRQTGGTFLVSPDGKHKYALSKPVKAMKRQIMKLVTAKKRQNAKDDKETPGERTITA